MYYGVIFTYIHKFIPYYASVYIHTNTHILKPSEDHEPTGLKVDIAKTDDSNTMSIIYVGRFTFFVNTITVNYLLMKKITE